MTGEYLNIEDDNCCFCYYDGLRRQLPKRPQSFVDEQHDHIQLIYANFHSDVIIIMLNDLNLNYWNYFFFRLKKHHIMLRLIISTRKL